MTTVVAARRGSSIVFGGGDLDETVEFLLGTGTCSRGSTWSERGIGWSARLVHNVGLVVAPFPRSVGQATRVTAVRRTESPFFDVLLDAGRADRVGRYPEGQYYDQQ